MQKNIFPNKLICFEGIDGSGKTELAKLLTERINKSAELSERGKVDNISISLVVNKLQGIVSAEEINNNLINLRYGGAIQIEKINYKNPIRDLKKSDFFKLLSPNEKILIHLLSTGVKDKIIRAFLPIVNIVCDRYLQSILARAKFEGAKLANLDKELIDLIEPDLVFLLTVENRIRIRRLIERAKINGVEIDPFELSDEILTLQTYFASIQENIIIDNTSEGSLRALELILLKISDTSKEKRPNILKKGFSSEKYFEGQLKEFIDRSTLCPEGGNVYIEFGGKIVDDHHAARVLPGYDPNIKIEILKQLQNEFNIVLAVSFNDLLRPRLRGDTQLFYNRETIEVIQKMLNAGIKVGNGIITLYNPNAEEDLILKISKYEDDFFRETGIRFSKNLFLEGYPDLRDIGFKRMLDNPRPGGVFKKTVVISPGGGSGKFGVCLSALNHDFNNGINSFYFKFETFPVYNLPVNHPVNLAFIAATSDLGNTLSIEVGTGNTAYNKDLENIALLIKLIGNFIDLTKNNPMSLYKAPSQMSINRVLDGIMNNDIVSESASQEIIRRKMRYTKEIQYLIEKNTTLLHFNSQISTK